MILEYGILFVVAILAGGWAIPAGLLFGLDPLGVYLTCVAASIVSTLVLLFLGGRFRPDHGRAKTRSSIDSFPMPSRRCRTVLRNNLSTGGVSRGWRSSAGSFWDRPSRFLRH